MKPHRGVLFVLDGPSAAGKTTLALALAKTVPNLVFVPRYTTRSRRAAESDSEEYVFVGADEFQDMIGKDEFIEYRTYLFGMSYGIPWKRINEILDTGRNAIGIINLDRVQVLKSRLPEAIAILLEVSPEILRRRLLMRGTNTEEQITERLESARAVDRLRPYYDHIVKNEGDLAKTLQELRGIIEQHVAKAIKDHA